MKYLLEHKYIKNFKVKKGLVSYAFMFGKTLFGKYVNSFFSAKKLQDLYNITEDERYSKKNCSPTRAARHSERKSSGRRRLTPDSSMSTAEPTNEAHNLSSMADDVLRAILARAVFDDQAALKRVCKRFLAVITSRSFLEERRASGCLEHTVLVRTHRLRTRPPTRGR